MDEILRWGLDVVIAVQQFRTSWLDSFFIFISSLGNDFFYFLLMPLIFWCVEKNTGARLIIIFCFSNWVNSSVKTWLQQPRPFNLEPSVKVVNIGGPGLPSGHAQGSLLVWGFLSKLFNNKSFYIFTAVFILVMALSRVYLGAHFPTDIFGGWILALGILIVYFLAQEKIESLFSKLNLLQLMLLSLFIPIFFALIAQVKYSVYPMAVLSGFAAGYCLELKYVGFENSRSILNNILRYLIGLLSAGVISFGLKIVSDMLFADYYLVSLYIRFWITGFFVSFGAPWIFKRLNI